MNTDRQLFANYEKPVVFFNDTLDIGISQCYTWLYRSTMHRSVQWGDIMDIHIKKVYVPMTETGFYILLCLREESHGYGIVKKTELLTNGEIKISPGTLYGSLSKMEKDGLIKFIKEEDKRKIYGITELGTEVLELEMKRIERLYKSMVEAK